MALGSGNIQIDVGARGLESDIVRQVRSAERKIRPISVSLDDKGFRQPLGRISGDMGEFQKSLDASVARTLAFGAAVGVLNAVTQGFKAMVTSAVEVEKALTDINVILNLNSGALNKFSEDLFNTARNTGQSFQVVSEAAVELSRQGLGAEETISRINDAMILTRLSGMDAAKSVETLTAAVNGFGDAALTTTDLVNKLATVDAAFAVSTEDLSNALARAGSTAQSAKVSLDQLLAAVTSVQQTTARGGSVIGNAFKSIFTRIQRSGVREALEDIGVATTDSAGNIRNALDILKDYAGVYKTLSDSQRAYTDELVAGVFQINNLKALVKDLGSDYSIYERALNQSNGATDEAVKRNEKLQSTLSALINEAAVNAKELASVLGDLVATPAVENLLKIFNSIAGALNSALDPEKGNSLIKNFFGAIGNFIAGPGLIIIGVAFIKLFKFITFQSAKALKEVFKIGSAKQKIAEAEAKIGFLLKNNKTLYEAISRETLSHEQKEELVLDTIRQQNAAYAAQQAMVSRLAKSRRVGAAVNNTSGGARNKADGYVPNFANGVSGAMSAERQAILAGEGGASSSARPKVLPNFPMGGGRKETIVANTDEYIVPRFGGGSGSAIFNKEMVKKAGGVPQGAIPVSGGFIPNFAKGKSGLATKGSNIEKSSIWKNATTNYPSLSVDVDKQLGGFGMISLKGNSGPFNKAGKLNPFGSNYLGPEQGKKIIQSIAGSRLNAQEQGLVLRKISKLGGGALGVSFENIGGSTFSKLNEANANDFSGQKGVFNDIIGNSIANATANISAKIYGRLFGDEIKANDLVSSVWKEADKSKIVDTGAEGSIFEAAIRLGSKASAKTFGTNSSQATWDFEESSSISRDLKDMFFTSSGYPNILKADAKRVGSASEETKVIKKAYGTSFFKERLEGIHTQQYAPLVQKAILAKNDVKSKAGGYIPNFINSVPDRAVDQFTGPNYKPQDIKKFGKLKPENQNLFKKSVKESELASFINKKLRDDNWRDFISNNFVHRRSDWSKNNYKNINENSLANRAENFKVQGDKSAYIYTRGSKPSQWQKQINSLMSSEKEKSKIPKKLVENFGRSWYGFDSVSMGSPEMSKSNIDYQELRGRIDKSVKKGIKGKSKISMSSLLGIGEEIFPNTNASIDEDWRAHFQSILKGNKKYYTARIKEYNRKSLNPAADKQNKGRVTGRIFEELITSAQKAVNKESGYLSQLDNNNWDFYSLTEKEKEVLNISSSNFGDYKTTLDSSTNQTSFLKKFIREPYGNAAEGFTPNFAEGLSAMKHFEKNSYGRHGTTLDLQTFFPKGGAGAISTLFKDVISKAQDGNPYEKIVAGEIVGPRIPKMIVSGKKLIEKARSKGLAQPKMRIEGRFDPAWLLGRLGSNKKHYNSEQEKAKKMGRKFSPSQRTGVKKGKLSSKYVPGETKALTKTFKAMGVPGPYDKVGREYYLQDLPMFRDGFAGGYIPNFADALEEAIVREREALSSQRSNAKIYVDKDNRLKGSKNPMGLLVANTRDEPLSGSQGVDRALSTGINPKNKGSIESTANGYVPNFAVGGVVAGGKGLLTLLGKIGPLFKSMKGSVGGFLGKGSKFSTIMGGLSSGFKKIFGLLIAAELAFVPILKTMGIIPEEFTSITDLIGEGLGRLFGTIDPGIRKLIKVGDKYIEASEKQLNVITQNIEKVDKFAATLANLSKSTDSGNIEAYGKFLEQLISQAGDMEGIDATAFQNLLDSAGDAEGLKKATQELKDLIEQGKNLKGFGVTVAETFKKLAENIDSETGKVDFDKAGVTESDIKGTSSQLIKNLSPEKVKQLAEELKGFDATSENSADKIASLQHIFGELDATTLVLLKGNGEYAKKLLESAAAQARYNTASAALAEAINKTRLPIKNLEKDFNKLATAIESSSAAIDASYKSLSEIEEIKSKSRVDTLKSAGTVTSTNIIKGTADAKIEKAVQDAAKESEKALGKFSSTILRNSKENGQALDGGIKTLIEGIADGSQTNDSAIQALIEIEKTGTEEQKKAAAEARSELQSANTKLLTEQAKTRAVMNAQLAEERNQAVAFQRNTQLSEGQLKSLQTFSRGQQSSLAQISELNKVISTIQSLGGNKDILAELQESNRQQSQLSNLNQAFSSLASGAGVEFNASSLDELDGQVTDFIRSDSFNQLDEKTRALVVALTSAIDKAKSLEADAGVKTQGDVSKAATTVISQESIKTFSDELKLILSGPLVEALKVNPIIVSKLNEPLGELGVIAQEISNQSTVNLQNQEANKKIKEETSRLLTSVVSEIKGSGLKDSSSNLEKSAILLEKAAAKITGNNASGFIPNFAPVSPVSRALNTERSMGAKKPVIDSHPSVGAYVRDAATQPNFSAVRRDHPEGMNKAVSNSAKIQGAAARGLVPNFAEPEGDLSSASLAEIYSQAMGKSDKLQRIEEYIAEGGKTTMQASKVPGWNLIKKEIYRQTGLGKEDPLKSGVTLSLDTPPDYEVLNGEGNLGAFDPTTEKLWMSEFPTKGMPNKALSEIQSTLANESIHWIQNKYKKQLGGFGSKEYQQWLANTMQKQDKALGGVGFGEARYAKSFDDIGINKKAGAYQDFLEGKKFSQEEVLKRFDIKDIKNLPGLDDMMKMGTPAEAWLANDLRYYAPHIMEMQSMFWKKVGLTHKKAMGLGEISKSVGSGVDRLRTGYLVDTAPTAWPKFRKTGDPRDLQIGPDLLGLELDMFLNDPEFRGYWFDEKGNSKFLKNPQETLKTLGKDVDVKPLHKFMKDIQSVFKKKEGSDQLGYESLRGTFTDNYNISVAKLLTERMSHMASIGVRNLQKEKGGNKFAPLAGGFIPNFAKTEDESFTDSISLADKEGIVKNAYFGGSIDKNLWLDRADVPPFVDKQRLGDLYKKSEVFDRATKIRENAIDPLNYKDYTSRINKISSHVPKILQNKFSNLLFSDKSGFAEWSKENYEGLAENVTGPLETTGDVLGGTSLAAAALIPTPLAPIATPTAALAGTLSTMAYAGAGIGGILSDTFEDPEKLRGAYNALFNNGYFASKTSFGEPAKSLIKNGAPELLGETLKKSYGNIAYPLFHKMGGSTQPGLLQQAAGRGELDMDLFSIGSSTLRSSKLKISDSQKQIAQHAMITAKFGTGSGFEAALSASTGLSGVGDYFNGINVYKKVIDDLSTNESYNIPFDFKDGEFTASGKTGWKVGEKSTPWNLGELEAIEKKIEDSILWKDESIKALQSVKGKSANEKGQIVYSKEKADEDEIKIQQYKREKQQHVAAGSLARKYMTQFKLSKESRKNMIVNQRGNINTGQLDGRLLTFPNPFVQGADLFSVATPDMRDSTGQGGKMYLAYNNLLDHRVHAGNRNEPTADATKFIDDTFENGAITNSKSALNSFLSTDFDSFISKMSLVKPQSVSSGLTQAFVALMNTDVEGSKEAIEKNRRQKSRAQVIKDKGLAGVNANPKDKDDIQGPKLPGADAFDPVVQGEKDALAELGMDPQVILDRLKEEETANQTRETNIRDQLYLKLLNKETEKIRGSDASVNALSRMMRISDKMPFMQDQLDKMIFQRQRRAKSIRDNPNTTVQANLSQIESEIGALQSRRSLYEPGNEEGMAYLYFTQGGQFSKVGGDQRRLGPPMYESVPDYAKKFQELREALRLNGPTDAENRMKEIKEGGEELKGVMLSDGPNVMNFARMRNQKGNKGVKTGGQFEKFFTDLDIDSRMSLMRSLGARDEHDLHNHIPDDLRTVLEENLMRVGQGNPAFGFLVDETINKGFGLGEDHFINAVKNLGVPFHSSQGVGDQLSKEQVKISGKQTLEGMKSFDVNALEGSDIEGALSFMNKIQIQDWLHKNKEEAENIQGNPFQHLTEILAGTSHAELMKSPVYLKYLMGLGQGFNPDTNLKSALLNKGNVGNFDKWKSFYHSGVPRTDFFKNENYGPIEWSKNVEDKLKLNRDGLNPFVELLGDAELNTEKKMLSHLFGPDLTYGANQSIDDLVNNTTNPIPKLKSKDWQNRAEQASKHINDRVKNISNANTGNEILSSYAPFGYDSLGTYKRNSPYYSGSPSMQTLWDLIMENKVNFADANAAGKAKGFVPNFSAIAGEIAASKMAGYKNPVKPSQVKTMNISGIGKTSYNTQESVFKAAGMSQPFIAPPSNSKAAPQYQKQVQKKFNFDPYKKAAADGFIPKGGSSLDFSEFKSIADKFSETTSVFASAISDLRFDEFSKSTKILFDGASMFSAQSQALQNSAGLFKDGSEKIARSADIETVNFEKLTSAASKIEKSFNTLSSELKKSLSIDSSGITRSMDSLTSALGSVQGSISVSIPSVQVNVNGAGQITQSIKSVIMSELPGVIKSEIESMDLVTKSMIGQ